MEIEDIRQRIVNICNCIDEIILYGRSYSMDTGHGRQQVTRENLPSLQNALEYWEMKLQEKENPNKTVSGEVFR